MKRDKLALKLGKKTLLEHSISVLEEINSSQNISVVLAQKPDNFLAIKTLTDVYKDRGTLGGIHSALANCREKYAVIIAVDYPFVTKDLLEYLLEIAKSENAVCVAPIQEDGIIQPLCAVYETKTCLQILSAILEHSDKTPSARDFLKRIKTRFVNFSEIEHLPNSENFFFNVNTPEDYEKALEIFQGE